MLFVGSVYGLENNIKQKSGLVLLQNIRARHASLFVNMNLGRFYNPRQEKKYHTNSMQFLGSVFGLENNIKQRSGPFLSQVNKNRNISQNI